MGQDIHHTWVKEKSFSLQPLFGHLIASLAILNKKASSPENLVKLDAQVLVYPGLDGSDWQSEDTCGFYDVEGCLPAARALLSMQEDLLGGPGFAAPPTLLVASKYDQTCPPERNTDRY